MARGIGAGIAELHYVATIGTYTAPTAVELNAGVDLTAFLTDGGLTTPLSGSTVDGADMSSAYNKTSSGTYGGQPLNAEMFKDLINGSDTAFTTLPRGTAGYLAVVRRPLATKGTFAIGDYVDIWPIDVITRDPLPIQRNELQRFMVECAVTSVPAEDFPIAA